MEALTESNRYFLSRVSENARLRILGHGGKHLRLALARLC